MHSEQLEKCGLYCKIQWKACPRPGLLCTYGPELAQQQPVLPSTQPEPYTAPRQNVPDLDWMADSEGWVLPSSWSNLQAYNAQLTDLNRLVGTLPETWSALPPYNLQLTDLGWTLNPEDLEGWGITVGVAPYEPMSDHLIPPSPSKGWGQYSPVPCSPELQRRFRATPNTEIMAELLPLVLALMPSILVLTYILRRYSKERKVLKQIKAQLMLVTSAKEAGLGCAVEQQLHNSMSSRHLAGGIKLHLQKRLRGSILFVDALQCICRADIFLAFQTARNQKPSVCSGEYKHLCTPVAAPWYMSAVSVLFCIAVDLLYKGPFHQLSLPSRDKTSLRILFPGQQ